VFATRVLADGRLNEVVGPRSRRTDLTGEEAKNLTNRPALGKGVLKKKKTKMQVNVLPRSPWWGESTHTTGYYHVQIASSWNMVLLSAYCTGGKYDWIVLTPAIAFCHVFLMLSRKSFVLACSQFLVIQNGCCWCSASDNISKALRSLPCFLVDRIIFVAQSRWFFGRLFVCLPHFSMNFVVLQFPQVLPLAP
jgi:hypothetical protein